MMPTYEPFDWYATPLYYDIIFDADTRTEAAFLQEVHERYVEKRKGKPSLLEPACGSGRLLLPMAERGFAVSGFDVEPAMLAMAKDRLKQAGVKGMLKRAAFDDFSFGSKRFDMGFCLVSSFKYVLEEGVAREHLRRMAEHICPGGVYVLGVHITEYSDRRQQRERWVAQRDGVHVVCNIASWPADRKKRTERVRSRLIATHADGSVKRYESQWDFRTYSVRELRSLVASEPRFEHVGTYTFHHDIEQPCKLGDENLGVVLILLRR
jgi:SAM-dependent methyltransferase